jgi:hypothetical protein
LEALKNLFKTRYSLARSRDIHMACSESPINNGYILELREYVGTECLRVTKPVGYVRDVKSQVGVMWLVFDELMAALTAQYKNLKRRSTRDVR